MITGKGGKTNRTATQKKPPLHIGLAPLIMAMWRSTQEGSSTMIVPVLNMVTKYHIPHDGMTDQHIANALRYPWDYKNTANGREDFGGGFDWSFFEDKKGKEYLALQQAFKVIGVKMPSLTKKIMEAA